MAYWVRFDNRSSVCVDTRREDVEDTVVGQLGQDAVQHIKSIQVLPYPANPRIGYSDCPPFCIQPDKCAGKGCCPRVYACND